VLNDVLLARSSCMFALDSRSELNTESSCQQRSSIERKIDRFLASVVADAFSEGLVLCDVSQKGQPIVFVNEGWENITGYSIQEVLGAHCGSLLEVSSCCSFLCGRLLSYCHED
jgi:PAS domain-containing protein